MAAGSPGYPFTRRDRAFLLTSEGLLEEDAADVPCELCDSSSNPIAIEQVNDDDDDDDDDESDEPIHPPVATCKGTPGKGLTSNDQVLRDTGQPNLGLKKVSKSHQNQN